jgi:predicted molibdopterin-dependent oxidoreductase YjgC
MPLDPSDGLSRGAPLSLRVDGETVTAFRGESVAAVLIASGGVVTRSTAGGAPRGVFCGMGVCFDCLVVVNGVANTRACMTLVEEGMVVERQEGRGPLR